MSEQRTGHATGHPRHTLGTDFLDAALDLLREVRDAEAASVAAGGALLAETVAAGGTVFTYGAGHSSLPAQDAVYRAGGLAVVNLLPAPGLTGVDVRPATLGSALEQVGGLAGAMLRTAPVREGDALVLVSLSGRNALPVELAQGARERGMRVIGVTSRAYTRGTAARTASGTFLADHCDVVVDNHIPVGDAALSADGLAAPFAPASTVVVSALVQALVASAVGDLLARGITPPLLRSGNVDGGHEWNAKVVAENPERVLWAR